MDKKKILSWIMVLVLGIGMSASPVNITAAESDLSFSHSSMSFKQTTGRLRATDSDLEVSNLSDNPIAINGASITGNGSHAFILSGPMGQFVLQPQDVVNYNVAVSAGLSGGMYNATLNINYGNGQVRRVSLSAIVEEEEADVTERQQTKERLPLLPQQTDDYWAQQAQKPWTPPESWTTPQPVATPAPIEPTVPVQPAVIPVTETPEVEAPVVEAPVVEPSSVSPQVQQALQAPQAIVPEPIQTPAASEIVTETLARATLATQSVIQPLAVLETEYTLTIVNSIVSEGTTPTGSSLVEGAPVTLKAIEDGEHPFTGWSTSDVAGLTPQQLTAPDLTFNMPANNVTITANYDTASWRLDIENSTTEPLFKYVTQGTSATVSTAADKDGQLFSHWEATNVTIPEQDKTQNPFTFTMPNSIAKLTAVYNTPPVTQYTLAVVGGTVIEPTVIPAEYNENEAIKVALTLASIPANYEFDKWVVAPGGTTLTKTPGGAVDLTNQEIAFDMPAANITITATYKALVSTVTGVTVTPSTATIEIGKTKAFTASVVGANSPSQAVTWTLTGNNSINTSVTASGIVTIGSNESKSPLTLTATSVQDNNVKGIATITVTQSTADPVRPYITSDLSSRYYDYRGNNITLSIRATISDNGTLSYRWYKDDSSLSGETSSSLYLRNLRTSDTGDYYCIVTNTLNGKTTTTKSNTTWLKVYYDYDEYYDNYYYDNRYYSSSGYYRETSTSLSGKITLNGSTISASNISTKKDEYKVTLKKSAVENGTAYVSIPQSVLNTIYSSNKSFVFNIESEFGNYYLPANIKNIADDFQTILDDNNLRESAVSIKLSVSEKSTNRAFKNAVANNLTNGKVVGPVIEYKLEVIRNSNSKSIGELDSFSQPITRTLVMPSSVKSMPVNYGTFKLNESTGNLEFVPHKVSKSGGVYTVDILSNTNSIYFVAENSVSFNDVPDGMWYTYAIKTAASKGILKGTGSGMYQPNANVTRAEFVHMVVNVMQLPQVGSRTASYSDVASNSWYYTSIMKARSSGMLEKFSQTSFSPNSPITREEMASILASAVKANGSAANTSTSLTGLFADSYNINANYQSDIGLIYNMQIMQGVGGGYFDPKGLSTRAQAATVLVNMLMKLNMI